MSLLLLPAHAAEDEEEPEPGEDWNKTLVRGMARFTDDDVQDLLSKRAEVNCRDDSGWTPLTAAVAFGSQHVVEELLKTQKGIRTRARIRLDDRNAQGRSALHVSARKGRHDLVPLLLRARCTIDLQDTEGWTALHHAAYNGNSEVIYALVEASADILIQGRGGLTPSQVTKLKTVAGHLSEQALDLLRPPASVDFTKHIIPVLKDEDMTPYDKLQAIIGLHGVGQNARNLRLHEFFFDPRHGPNKARLRKMWEGLAQPMLQRLKSGQTDLSPLEKHMAEEERNARLMEIKVRAVEQKQFLRQWFQSTKGLRPSQDWKHCNRLGYGDELEAAVAVERCLFQEEVNNLYVAMQEEEGCDTLVSMPAEEVPHPKHLSQLSVHPIPVWLEDLDPEAAFEALRSVAAYGMGTKDDEDALLAWADLLTTHGDFDTGEHFWLNAYKLWLSEYAKAADSEFQSTVKRIVDRFNEMYACEGLEARYHSARAKTYQRLKAKEREFGIPDAKTYNGRTVASRILDVVRGSITVDSPRAAHVLVEDFFKPLSGKASKLKLVRVVNGFSKEAPDRNRRFIEMNVSLNCGSLVSRCGRPGVSIRVAVVGEVQINVERFLAVRKRCNLLTKFAKGDFDWPPEESCLGGGASMGGTEGADDLPMPSR